MKTPIDINIQSINIDVKTVDRENTLAIVELRYIDDQNTDVFIIRGVTVKKKYSPRSGRLWLSVDFPAYPGKNGKFFKSFIIPTKETWMAVARLVLNEFHVVSNGKYSDLETNNEQVNPDEIPDFSTSGTI